MAEGQRKGGSLPSVLEEDIFTSGKVRNCEPEECYCGAKPPNGLMFGIVPCWHMKFIKGIKPMNSGHCGLNHWVYKCRTCQKTYGADQIWGRIKVFIMKDPKVVKKVLVKA